MAKLSFQKKNAEVKSKPQGQRTTAADVAAKSADKPPATAPAPKAAEAVAKNAPASQTAKEMTVDASNKQSKAGDKPVLPGTPRQQEQQRGLIESFTNGVNEKLKQQGVDAGISVQDAARALSGAGVSVTRNGVEVPAGAVSQATGTLLTGYADRVNVETIVAAMRNADIEISEQIQQAASRVDKATAGALRLLVTGRELVKTTMFRKRVVATVLSGANGGPEILAEVVLTLARNQVAAAISAGRLDEALRLRPNLTHAESFLMDVLGSLPLQVTDALEALDIRVVV